MVTLVLIVLFWIAILIPATHFLYKGIGKKTGKSFSAATAPLTWFAVALIISFVGIVGIPNIAKSEMIRNATEIAIFEDGTLYHNMDDDTYFCIASDDWNPKKSYHKIYVDKSTAEKGIKSYENYIKYQKEARFLFNKEN